MKEVRYLVTRRKKRVGKLKARKKGDVWTLHKRKIIYLTITLKSKISRYTNNEIKLSLPLFERTFSDNNNLP